MSTSKNIKKKTSYKSFAAGLSSHIEIHFFNLFQPMLTKSCLNNSFEFRGFVNKVKFSLFKNLLFNQKNYLVK